MVRIGVVPTLAMLSATFCASGAALGADAPAGSTAVVLVEVNGAKITLADLEQKHPAAIFQARTNYYDTERKAIEEMTDQALLDQQAKKEGLTVAELLERHVNATIAKDPSEEALQVYYEGVETTEPYEAVRARIVDALRQRRIAKAKAAYMASLRSQSSIVMRLAPPRAPISMKDVPVRGAAGAPVTLLEFADFECPYCQQIQPVLDKIEAEFKGKVAFAYKDFPLPMHPDAEKAAEATRCAAAQGKYWEFHDMLFARKQLSVSDLKNDAAELKLDTAAFGSCLDLGKMAGVVKESAAEAGELNLQGTPTFFVNGRYISGTANYEKLRSIITEELSAQEMETGLATQNRRQN